MRMSAYMCTYYWRWHWQTMFMSLRQVYVEAWRSLVVENLQQNKRSQCSSKLMNYLILQSLLLTSIMERISYPEILRKIEQLVLLFLFYPPQYFKYSPWQPRIRISGERGGMCTSKKKSHIWFNPTKFKNQWLLCMPEDLPLTLFWKT